MEGGLLPTEVYKLREATPKAPNAAKRDMSRARSSLAAA